MGNHEFIKAVELSARDGITTGLSLAFSEACGAALESTHFGLLNPYWSLILHLKEAIKAVLNCYVI